MSSSAPPTTTSTRPCERLKIDLDLMADAHFTVIRVGESVWSTWEPENGLFDLDWLQPVLDGAHARGISVVLGTPTYAVPPWLARHYPEIAGERATGQRIGWGARQEVDFTHPAFRFHAERVIRKIVARYADHPAVIGFQVDNEPGIELLHNHGVFQRFVDHLRHRYGDVETLNTRVGPGLLVASPVHLGRPVDARRQRPTAVRTSPGVASRRTQTTEFIDWQADIVREYARPDQFVTTCLSYEPPGGGRRGPDRDARRHRRQPLLRHAGRPRPARPRPNAGPQAGRPTGTWALYLSADRMFSSRQEPFLVTETNAQSIGYPWDNRPGLRRPVAAGRLGARLPRRTHDRVLALAHAALRRRDVLGRRPAAQRPAGPDVPGDRRGSAPSWTAAGEARRRAHPGRRRHHAVLHCRASGCMQAYPPLAPPDGGAGSTRVPRASSTPSTAARSTPGCQVRILHAGQVTAGERGNTRRRTHPVLVVPGLYIADDATLDWLADYADAGGHLVLGPRTGYADDEARARAEVAARTLAEAAGAWYDEFSNLEHDLPVRPRTAPRCGLPDGRDGDPLGRRPACRRRRRPRQLRPPALRPLAGGHHPSPRRRPGHLRRHRTVTHLRRSPLSMGRTRHIPVAEHPALGDMYRRDRT